jgi:hypothetical protein
VDLLKRETKQVRGHQKVVTVLALGTPQRESAMVEVVAGELSYWC